MNPDQLIESYVSDVIRRLPRGQRTDVAAELRALMREELADRAASHDGEPTEAEAMALLNGFGRPADVAARYRPTLTIIDPVDSRAFLKSSVIGVAIIWVAGLVSAFQHRPASIEDGLLALRDFYAKVGLQALIWPGFLVVWFGLAAWARRRWPRTAVWKPRPAERDMVNRFGTASAVLFGAVGAAVLANPGGALNLVSGGRLSAAGYAAFAYDSGFLTLRGPAVLAVIVADLAVLLVIAIRGRWEPATRRAQLVLNVVTGGVLLWVLFGGPAFSQQSTDQLFKVAVGATVLGILIDLVVKGRRQRLRIAATAAPKIS